MDGDWNEMMRCEIYNLTHQSCNFTASVIPLKSASPDVQGLSLPCTGTVSFSLLSCALLSTFYLVFFLLLFLKHSCRLSRRLPATLHHKFPRLFVTCFQIIWTLIPCPSGKLLERQSLGWFQGWKCAWQGRENGWGGGGRDHMWPFILRYLNSWQHSRSVIFCTSSCFLITQQVVFDLDDIQSPQFTLYKCLSHNRVDKWKIIFPALLKG